MYTDLQNVERPADKPMSDDVLGIPSILAGTGFRFGRGF